MLIQWILDHTGCPTVAVAITTVVAAVALAFLWRVYLIARHKDKDHKDGQRVTRTLDMPPDGATMKEFLDAMLNGKSAHVQRPWLEKYGPVFTIRSPLPKWILPNQVYAADPDVVRDLCVRQANMYRPPSRFTTRDPTFARNTRNTVGVGVTGLVGEEWRWRKDALLREFKRQRMLDRDRRLIEKVVDEGRRLCGALEEGAASGEPVYVDLLTTRAAVGVVLYFLLGRDLDFDAGHLRQAAKDLMDVLAAAFSIPGYDLLKRVPGTRAYRTTQKKFGAWKVVDDIVADEIEMLLDEDAGRRPVHPDRTPGSVIASLIENQPLFKRGGVKSMIAEARVFVQAGFETSE